MPETQAQHDGSRRSAPQDGLSRVPGPRRRTSLKRIVASLFLTMLLVGVVVAGAALWGIEAVKAPGPLAEPTTVVIERGKRTPEIGETLERHGVISDHRLFVAAAYLTRLAGGNLIAGEYEFPAGASLARVLAIIRSGRAVVHKLTVPEGWTSAQVVERVNAHPALTGTVTEVPGEGTLLPDTYVFQRGLARDALLARMREAQDKLLDELWEGRAAGLPVTTRQEAVILASIVEKETGLPEERRQVAAVFINRLNKKMRLQSDPTIIYGIAGGRGRLHRPIRQSDIAAKTDYNTYQLDGLPPTPIANPGREALAAVLQPDDTDHLYFVADGTGGHVFARTLEEHQGNVRKWRKIELEARAEAEAQTPVSAETETAAVEPDQPVAPGSQAAEIAVQPTDISQTDGAAVSGDPPAGPAPPPMPGAAEAENDPAPEQEPLPMPEQKVEETPAAPGANAAEAPPPSPKAVAPVPRAKPRSAITLANRLVPIPRPKPKRN